MGKFAGTFILTDKKDISSSYIKLISKRIPNPISVIPIFINVKDDLYLFGFINSKIINCDEYDYNIEQLRMWCKMCDMERVTEMNITVSFDKENYKFYVKGDES